MLREYTVHTHILGKDGGDVHDEASMNAMGRRFKENSINFEKKDSAIDYNS